MESFFGTNCNIPVIHIGFRIKSHHFNKNYKKKLFKNSKILEWYFYIFLASSSARFNRICRTGAGIKRKLIFHKHQGSNWILSRICVQDLAFWKLQIAKCGQKRKVWQLKVKKRGNCELLFLYNVKDFLCLSLQNLMPHLLPNSSNTKTKKAPDRTGNEKGAT